MERRVHSRMSKLGKTRPGKRDIIVSLVIFAGVAILLLFSYSSPLLGYTPEYARPSVAPGTSNSGAGQSFGSSSLFQTVPTSASTSNRVINTSEALVGQLRHGRFEPVTSQIVSNLNLIGGYVDSSNLMYNGTTWFGIYSVNVPSSEATSFLYNVTNIVNENGDTTSVQIETHDVTNQTGGNQSKVPYSLFAITLQEEANTTNVQATNQFSSIFGSIGSILSVVLSDAAYVVLIALPIYFVILGGVLLSGRVLYPVFQRVSKSSQERKQDDRLP
jgi:hypothetical protein